MDAATIIGMAAEQADADLYAPGEWDGDEASAFAMVRRANRRQVLTMNADDLIYVLTEGNVWGDLYAYGYASETDVTDADGVRRAMVREDGASLDPVGEGIVMVSGTQSAEDIANMIVAAMAEASDGVDSYEEGEALRAEIAASLPDGLTASRLNTDGEEFVAVLVSDARDVATVVKHGERYSLESMEEDSTPEFGTLSDAVAAILTHVAAR